MQTDPQWQDQILVHFMQLSRRHLGLMQAPLAVRPPRRVAGPLRQILRSLLVAGSLGALFGGRAFATEASHPTDLTTKHSTSTLSTRARLDNPQDLVVMSALSGKYR